MNLNTFKTTLSALIGSTSKKLPTLGRNSHFYVYFDNSGNVALKNSKGNICIITQSDFDICKKQYCSLRGKKRFQGKYYTDSKLRVPIGRTHAPLIPAVFRYLCENGYCICENCKDGKCLI